MEIVPITPVIGAEVRGVDLGQALADETVHALRNALNQHHVLVFRDQALTPEAHKRFGSRFGTPCIHPFREPMGDHPELLPQIKEPHERQNIGGGWHSDMTFLPEPPLGTLLYAIELPKRGGDTLFASSIDAYEGLSEGFRSTLDGLRAAHTAEGVHGVAATRAQSSYRQTAADQSIATDVTIHPLVRTHPETGRRGLFVNAAFTVGIEGLSPFESRPLLDQLFEHQVKAEYVMRLRWEVGTLAFWDNRCTQHYALNDYHGERREMRRMMVAGDRPV